MAQTLTNSGKPEIQPGEISSEPLWTVEDVAAYLKINTTTVRQLARDRKLPGVKIGRFWRFQPSMVKSVVLSLIESQSK